MLSGSGNAPSANVPRMPKKYVVVELRKRGLPVSGTIDVLKGRLMEVMVKEEEKAAEKAARKQEKREARAGEKLIEKTKKAEDKAAGKAIKAEEKAKKKAEKAQKKAERAAAGHQRAESPFCMSLKITDSSLCCVGEEDDGDDLDEEVAAMKAEKNAAKKRAKAELPTDNP